MPRFPDVFSSDALVDCVSVLRTRAYDRFLWDLVRLIDEHIVEPQVRKMLGQLTRTGRLRRIDSGRDARYAVTDRRNDIARLKITKNREPWSGLWHVFTYDVPTTHNAERHRLVRWLRDMGFARIGRSSWVSPYDWAGFLEQTLRDWDCDGRFHCFGASSVVVLGDGNGFSPADLWALDSTRREYERIARILAKRPSGRTKAARQARARTLLRAQMGLTALERTDPLLPEPVLPKTWPRERVLTELARLTRAVESDIGAQS